MLPSFSDPTDHRLAIKGAHRLILSLKEATQQLSVFSGQMDERVAAAKARLDSIDARLDGIDAKVVLARTAILQLRADFTALELRIAALEAA